MEVDGGWRCSEKQVQDCHRKEMTQEENCHREESKKPQRECHRAQQLDENCHRDQSARQERDCNRGVGMWAEPSEPVSTWRGVGMPQVGGGLEKQSKPPSGDERHSDLAALSISRPCKGEGAPPSGGDCDGNVPIAFGRGEEWRKKKHRRRPSKRKRRWKPYFKLSWEEKQQLEERESLRAARIRAEMFAKGQPVAPYNTTQFLMDDHAQAEPDLRSGGGTESSEEEPPEEEAEGPGSDGTGGPGSGLRPGGFLLKDFSETYERYHTESLQNMSKQQLVREYLELEKCLSRMEDENNRLRKQGARGYHRHPHKDSPNHDTLHHIRHPGAGPQHHSPVKDDTLQRPREDPHPHSEHYSEKDPHLLRENPSPHALPRGSSLQLHKGDPHLEVKPHERPHTRIRELEKELDRLRAQNTQLLQEKGSSLLNSCGD
ncbi:hypothetical protein NDU88_002958 [Pleurodeles waltl]|uniref:Uncharacterized protein n=2 Tax=Pleurodeles waltl TaxID=8319 RepID=A0AAV7QE58_PLEWA|nr:hypothetical protein NDU88_002958 [Pleurodeles waltl]